MFVAEPIVDQVALAVDRIDDDPRPRRRRRLAVEDAHLVVDEVHRLELRVERRERLAQRGVERVDRAVAVGRGVEDLALDLDLDGRLGQQLPALALLGERGVVDDPEGRLVAGRLAPDEQLERGLRALEREALVLELLDRLRQDLRVDEPSSRWPSCSARMPRVGAAAQLGDHEAALVADELGVDVLVAALDLGHRGAVDAALVRERGAARRTAGSRTARRSRSPPRAATARSAP